MSEVSLKKRIWGWMLFDWASQPYNTLILTFVFGPFFAAIATNYYMGAGLDEQTADAQAQSLWSLALTITGLIIAFTAPFLGSFADATGRKLPWVWFFSALYVIGAGALWWTNPDGSNAVMMLIMFGVGFIGLEFAIIFTNAILPSLGDKREVGKISGSAYAFGYWGGVLALAIMLLLFVEQENGKTLIGLDPMFGFDAEAREGTRFVGPFTALWYALFMIPFFLWTRDVPVQNPQRLSFSGVVSKLWSTIKRLKRSTASFLASSLFYRDALNGLYGFGGVYATLVLDWTIIQIGVFGVVGAITAAIFTWVGGIADKRYGPKPVLIVCVLVLAFVCLVIVGMTREGLFGIPFGEGSNMADIIFYICGATIGAAGGALQSASRSMMVRHSHPDRPTEAFGLYALSGKATAFLAPALIGLFTTIFNNPRLGITPLIVLFLLGLLLLSWVKAEGEQG